MFSNFTDTLKVCYVAFNHAVFRKKIILFTTRLPEIAVTKVFRQKHTCSSTNQKSQKPPRCPVNCELEMLLFYVGFDFDINITNIQHAKANEMWFNQRFNTWYLYFCTRVPF